jgi:cytochrome c5
MNRLRLPILAALTAAVLTVACDDHDDAEQCPDEHAGEHAGEHGESCGEEGEFGPPTESVCPEGSTLTWESFGQSFMQSYCTRCHASTLSGADRQGAPLYHDFDTLEGVLVVADHVDMKAASGPAATNELMPISAPTPSLMERQQLGEWLACELAKM